MIAALSLQFIFVSKLLFQNVKFQDWRAVVIHHVSIKNSNAKNFQSESSSLCNTDSLKVIIKIPKAIYCFTTKKFILILILWTGHWSLTCWKLYFTNYLFLSSYCHMSHNHFTIKLINKMSACENTFCASCHNCCTCSPNSHTSYPSMSPWNSLNKNFSPPLCSRVIHIVSKNQYC